MVSVFSPIEKKNTKEVSVRNQQGTNLQGISKLSQQLVLIRVTLTRMLLYGTWQGWLTCNTVITSSWLKQKSKLPVSALSSVEEPHLCFG